MTTSDPTAEVAVRLTIDGAEIEVAEGLSVGFRTHLNGWRGQRISEDSYDVSTLMWVDAGLRLQVQL